MVLLLISALLNLNAVGKPFRTVATVKPRKDAPLNNTCSKEELEEPDEGIMPQPSHPEGSVERRKVTKNKAIAAGRLASVFAPPRYDSIILIPMMTSGFDDAYFYSFRIPA